MDMSIWPSLERSWDEVLDVAHYAELTGWDGFWFADHLMPNTLDDAPSDGPTLECWAVLAALAAAVPRLRLGSLVTPTTMHYPAVLAKRAATVDHISGGRLVLGIGAGWQVNEHRAYGIDLLPLGERVSRFSEALQILRGLLLESRTTFAGRHLTVIDAPCEPKPLQQPLPILVGAAGPRMLRATARWADEWNTWGDLDQAAHRHGLLVAACEAVGRDVATLRRSVQAMVFLTDDRGTRRGADAVGAVARRLAGSGGGRVGPLRGAGFRRVHRAGLQPGGHAHRPPRGVGANPGGRAGAALTALTARRGASDRPAGTRPAPPTRPIARRSRSTGRS